MGRSPIFHPIQGGRGVLKHRPETMVDVGQWEFQDPKMEVPTIYKAYVWGLCKGIYPQNMARNRVLTYLHFLDPGIPIE